MPFLANWLLLVGVGLMGGSVARAARAAGVVPRILGIDPVHGSESLSLGLVDEVFDDFDQADPHLQELSGPGLVVFAAPVPVTARLLPSLASRWQAWGRPWFTELGSTKSAWALAVANVRALGLGGPDFLSHGMSSHPMAGSEAHGPQAAREDLFQGARVLLSSLPETTQSCETLWTAFWQDLGARTHALALDAHDPLLASISHLPHAVSFALGAQLSQSSHAQAAQWLHGGGLRDTTRIAASDPSLWADIFLDNREALERLLSDYQQQLDALGQALKRQDREGLIALLERSAHWRQGFQIQGK